MRRLLTIATATFLVSTWLMATNTQAASTFAGPQFQAQWQAAEAVVPNFWGPLSLARDGQQESYNGGQRLVQYFDKARMELAKNGTVTFGLLATELKTGKLQLGDATFEQRAPAHVNMAGDPGGAGPTYADLALLPEHDGRPSSGPPPYYWMDGKFGQAQNFPFGPEIAVSADHDLSDPSGRYRQWVFGPFWDFIQSLPLPLDQTTGYATSPLMWAKAKVGSIDRDVLLQAFERRVLTFTFTNSPATRVEFGNIGQHYYQWRYGSSPITQAVAPTPNVAADFTPFAKRWGAHGVGFVVSGDGSAHLDWRTYITCSATNPDRIPCEEPYTSYAGHATMQFVSVNGDEAAGNVLTSNDPRFQPANVVVRLVLKPYDMVELKEPTGQTYTFCGPDYAKLAPPEVRNTFPCGA